MNINVLVDIIGYFLVIGGFSVLVFFIIVDIYEKLHKNVIEGYIKIPGFLFNKTFSSNKVIEKALDRYNEQKYHFLIFDTGEDILNSIIKFDCIVGEIINIPLNIDNKRRIKIKVKFLKTKSSRIFKKLYKSYKDKIVFKFHGFVNSDYSDFYISHIKVKIDYNYSTLLDFFDNMCDNK